MVAFFPTPFPDELFYSVLARFHAKSGNISPKATIMDLYGTTTVTAVIDLPAHFDTLIEHLPVHHPYSSERLITAHTLYPFHSAFLPPKRASLVFESMKGDLGHSVHNRLGIMASSISTDKTLKYCPKCFEEDRTRWGEPYWHRVHQVPGVYICPIHRSPLCRSRSLPMNRHEFISAAQEDNLQAMWENSVNSNDVYRQNEMSAWHNAVSKITVLLEDGELSTKYLAIADNVDKLLQLTYPNRPMEWFANHYVERLKEIGLANVHGHVRQVEFRRAFLNYYGEPFLEVMQSSVSEREDNWLQAIVRKHRKTFHPLRHLLLAQFLDMSLDDLFTREPVNQPFGASPWLCLNPAADHYLQPVVKELSIGYDNKKKSPIGTFTCSCGFVYTRKGPDTNEDDKYRIGRIKTLGAVWEQKLCELLQENLSLREIARRLHVDVNTVKKYADVVQQSLIQASSPISDDLRERQRQAWIELVKQNGHKSRTELRRMNKALYTWLYRNDKSWLMEHSPRPKKVIATKSRVDWRRRDEEILSLVQTEVTRILTSDGKPERISISRIGKRIGCLSLLEKHLSKMPQTKSYLESVRETVEDFQIRRIKWAMQEIEFEGQDLQWWRIVRKAGIRGEVVYRLRERFDNDTPPPTVGV
ncbi:TnsD family Tn7-like transposition protein [Alicyclobacillus shizuokensis]|uniref:TnsD family Tn7-like transposition protein n=1 Tax=Alicyclobacillus shizuokensis TaxID=392014 RepID=UPI0009F99121|nr:TnsD family Tn7-like transposition protein [Alicyclobacillus shizuokensis]